jgi:hypothetical protein
MLSHVGSCGLADSSNRGISPGMLCSSARIRFKSWLAWLTWSRRLDPLWLSSSAGRNSLIYEDLVEGLPDETLQHLVQGDRTPLQETRRGSGPAPQCRPVAQSNAQHRILKTVDRIDSRYRSRCTVYPQVDSHDAVAIPIDPCELIEARQVQDCFRVIWTKLSSLDIHGPTFPLPNERKVCRRLTL